MILQKKTLEKLRDLINEKTEYRSGPQLVSFFNDLGFKDKYGSGFPSRWIYTDEKLVKINGHPEIDRCIKNLFSPVNFIGRFQELDRLIDEFNEFLAFDKWKVVRNNSEITFSKCEKIIIDNYSFKKEELKEDDFLKKEFDEISIDSLNLDGVITDILNARLNEIKKCLLADAPLSILFLCGSTLEGVLLGVASKNIERFNRSNSAPKDKDGKVKQLWDWSLNSLIDVSFEVGLLKEDVKKFSHSLRDFRNYIHPYQQLSSNFNPDKHSAKISWQVLRAALYQLSIK
jgi:hypothetical protein